MYAYPSDLQYGDIINNIRTMQNVCFLNFGNEQKTVKCASVNHFDAFITFTDGTIAAADSVVPIKIVRD